MTTHTQSGFEAFIDAWHNYDGPATKETREAFWKGWIAARRHDASLVADILRSPAMAQLLKVGG